MSSNIISNELTNCKVQ